MKRRYFMYAMMFVCITLFSQEYLTSPIYQYYRFLELDGTLPKKSLNYYSLSNSFYLQSIDKTHIWSKYLDLSKRDSSLIQTLPLETYASYNSSYSRGFNDGALWQGKGYNLSILGGVLMKKGGFSFALAPIFWYAQNLPFSMVPVDPSHSSPYGSFIPNIDEPQRFGASPVYHIDWGESEIRYTLNNLTVGIGTQSVWIGPAFKNALILSNNAGGFPKIDVGLYPYETSIGSFEA
ncbi:MAG: hypothetical protein N2442_02070, partial [Spirochaetes bacterium]|nr:hypothetical protein [Spirochaetota bacterium]